MTARIADSGGAEVITPVILAPRPASPAPDLLARLLEMAPRFRRHARRQSLIGTRPALRTWGWLIRAAHLCEESAEALGQARAELRGAVSEVSEWARKAGEAEGKLRASEMAGVLDGWRERAGKADSERDAALAKVAELETRLAGMRRVASRVVHMGRVCHEYRVTYHAEDRIAVWVEHLAELDATPPAETPEVENHA